MKERIISRIVGRFLCKLTSLRNRTQVELWKQSLGSVDATTILEYPLKISNAQCVHIGAETRISWGGWLCAITQCFEQRFHPEIYIGEKSYIGNNAHIVATKKVHIGNNVLIADRVYVSDNLHDYRDTGRSIVKNGLICCGEVRIGDDSWIGENVCVVGDVRIGRHCVVGANAFVNRSLPDFSVAVGAPARIVKRYNVSTRKWEPTGPDGRFLSDPFFDEPFDAISIESLEEIEP